MIESQGCGGLRRSIERDVVGCACFVIDVVFENPTVDKGGILMLRVVDLRKPRSKTKCREAGVVMSCSLQNTSFELSLQSSE
jgi:hypothetical protein